MSKRSCAIFGSPFAFHLAVARFGGRTADSQLYRGTLEDNIGDNLVFIGRSTHSLHGCRVESVTVSVPAAASIRRGGLPSTLADLQRGDAVAVILSDDGDYVLASDAAYVGRRRVALVVRET